MAKEANLTKKKWSMPDAYVILFGMLVIFTILTYILPAGQFVRETVNGITVVVPGSFETVQSSPVGFFDVFLAIQEGMIKGGGTIFLVLIIGGAFAVIESTGAIDASILKAIDKTKNREILLISIVAVMFSFIGLLGASVAAVIAFVPIGVMLAKRLKLDAMVGMSMIYLGAYAGFNTSFFDPLTIGLAQEIAQVPIFSGMGFRFIIYLTVLSVTIIYIARYARKVKKNPLNGVLGDDPFPETTKKSTLDPNTPFTNLHKLVLTWFVGGILFYILGVFLWSWGLNEMSALFIIIAVGTAILARINANRFVKIFFDGAKGILYGALIIGMARSIVVVLENGKILDTIVNGLASVMEPFSSVAGALVMYFVNLLFSLIITSGSGHAVIVMPIMTPLADFMDITRQVAVQAFKFADGFTNCITPASGILMACLAVSGIPFTKWFRFMLPLFTIWVILGAIFIVIAALMNWGPI